MRTVQLRQPVKLVESLQGLYCFSNGGSIPSMGSIISVLNDKNVDQS